MGLGRRRPATHDTSPAPSPRLQPMSACSSSGKANMSRPLQAGPSQDKLDFVKNNAALTLHCQRHMKVYLPYQNSLKTLGHSYYTAVDGNHSSHGFSCPYHYRYFHMVESFCSLVWLLIYATQLPEFSSPLKKSRLSLKTLQENTQNQEGSPVFSHIFSSCQQCWLEGKETGEAILLPPCCETYEPSTGEI